MLHRSLLLAGSFALTFGSAGACRPAASTTTPPPSSTPSASPSPSPSTSGESRAPTPAPAPAGASEWTLIAEHDGIAVTSRPSEQSPLPVFRGVGVVDAPLLEVLAVVTDAERHHEWIFSCSASGLIAQTTDTTGLVYNRTATPWPVPDRDVVLESRVEVLDGEREIVVRFSATEHPQKPPEDGVIRMTYLQGHYHLRAEDAGHTHVEYQVDSDPGGRLPTWLATRGTRDMPLQSLLGLRRQLVQTQGVYDERVQAIRRTVLQH